MSALVAASVTAASASGLVEIGLDDPHLIPPATISNDWGGVYGGISYGRTTSKRTTTVPQEPEEFFDTGVCESPGSVGSHGSYKCRFDKKTGPFTPHVWDTSPEIQELRFQKNPWNQEDLKRKGNPLGRAVDDEVVRYNAGYDGIWMNGEDFEFTYNYRQREIPASSLIFNEIANSDQVGAFLGYRRDFGTLVGGIEGNYTSDMQTVELQVGLDAGQLLPYGFVGAGSFDSQGGMVYGAGADLKLGQDGLMVGLKHTVGEFDDISSGTTAVRVGWQF